MTKSKYLVWFAILILTLMAAACSDNAGDVQQPQIGIKFMQQTSGCSVTQFESSQTNYTEGKLPSDVASLDFIVSSQSGTELHKKQVTVASVCDDPVTCILPDSSSFTLFDLPLQQNMHLQINAYDASKQLLWIGHNYNVDITTEQVNPTTEAIPVNVYMRRVGDITFAFNCMEIERVFHSATLLRDGMTVLITGGVSQIRENACFPEEFGGSVQCDLGVATKQVILFDAQTGSFKQMTPLDQKRAGHESILLADGRVLIIGGADQLWMLHGQDGRAYMEADLNNIHKTAVLYNPDGNGRVELVINMKQQRAFFTVTPIDTDPPQATRFLVAGGWGDGGRLSTMEMLTFDPAAAMTKPEFRLLDIQLKAGRSSHTATRLSNGQILFYGGVTPGEDVAEKFVSESADTELLSDIDGYTLWPDLYNHAASIYGDGQQVIISGGMQKTAQGTDEKLTDPVASAVFIDFTAKTSQQFNMNNQRAFHKMAVMPDNRVAVIGGVYDYKLREGVSDFELYSGRTNFADLKNPYGEVVQMGMVPNVVTPLARMGHTVTMLRDGSILIAGGAQPDPQEGEPTHREILRSGEIFYPHPDHFPVDGSTATDGDTTVTDGDTAVTDGDTAVVDGDTPATDGDSAVEDGDAADGDL